jgi:CO/xanthine dehydrogenase FAD-binding subunit
MQPIEYARPRSVDEAVQLLAGAGDAGRPLAGGTDVIVQVREGRRPQVQLLVDVKHLPETTELVFDQQRGLRIGAAVPCWRIYENETIQRLYPALVDSTALIGGTAIQGRASLGGNLCNASPAADSIPTLIALDGSALIAGPEGQRRVPVAEFCIAPGRTVLQEGEFLVALDFPVPAPHSGARFLRFIPRNEMDIAVVNAASWVQLDAGGQRIEAARIAVGAVAPTPLYVEAAGQSLVGKEPGEAAYAAAGALAQAAAKPIFDMRGTVGQRKHLVGVLVKRTLEGAVARARG